MPSTPNTEIAGCGSRSATDATPGTIPPVAGVASETRVFVEGFSRTMDKLQVVIVAIGGACWLSWWLG